MKSLLLTSLTTATCSLALLSCDSSEQRDSANQSAATTTPATPPNLATIEGFKQDVARLEGWYRKESEQLKQHTPTPEQLAVLRQSFIEQARKIPTQGLPADLQSAWSSLLNIRFQLDALVQQFPKPDPKSPQLLNQAATALQPQLESLHRQADALTAKLAELGTAYGIPGLESILPPSAP